MTPEGTALDALLDAQPLQPLPLRLPGGADVQLTRVLRHERRWPGRVERLDRLVPNKVIIERDGRPTWEETALVERLERQGWGACWVKNWKGSREFWSRPGTPIVLPDGVRELVRRMDETAGIGSSGGPWDVLAWHGTHRLWLEAKQHRSSDHLRANQLRWLGAGLYCGLSATDFAVVEYAVLRTSDSAPDTRR